MAPKSNESQSLRPNNPKSLKTKIIPQEVINAKRFFEETMRNNKKILNSNKYFYKMEDIEWMTQMWIKHYDKIRENPKHYYMTLLLLNRNTHSGRFALVYNDLIYAMVEKRKEKEFVKLLLYPEFPELFDNKYLDANEKKHLEKMFYSELKSLNLLMKFYENSKKIELIPSKTYNECFLQVSMMENNDSELELMKYASFESPTFATLAEYNENTDTYHMYSFDLLDLITLIVFQENNFYTNKPFSEQNIENVLGKYSTEVKMVKRAYGK